ncbi:hypothetical protein E3U43_013931 [Larimichthys crocea]|uniref:Uncharacterized protein n=1 Tax=Larimichthys crocea TaxID=215358 RepID=A0ACD3RBC0_LARCR|nr:hypothetical protein E3U43_013931 [Larimichthys crocea]
MNDTLEKTDVVTEEHWIPVLLSDKAQHFKTKILSTLSSCNMWGMQLWLCYSTSLMCDEVDLSLAFRKPYFHPQASGVCIYKLDVSRLSIIGLSGQLWTGVTRPRGV